MADRSPLLSKSDSAAETDPSNLDKHIPTLDETIQRCIGDFGWAQFVQTFLVAFAWVFDAQQTFITVFTDAEPTWHCTGAIGGGGESCNSASDICRLPKNSWAWDRPVHGSIVSEWGLECAGLIITGLPASSFFAGCLTGGLVLATLADTSLGRKNMLFLSCLMMSLAGVFTVFSNNIWTYSALKFVSGFGRATIGTCALVLSTELVGKRWRGQVGVVGFLCFTLGFLSLPAIAYINRASSWRVLYLWTSVPTFFYCVVVHFFVRESPRWLFVQGRKEEAVAILKSIAPKATTTNNSSNSCFLSTSWSFSSKQETWNVDLYSAIKILVTKRWAFRRLSAVMIAGFGIGMVYYGMPLALGNMSVNLYLSVTLNALSELPASLVTFFLIGRLNRKSGILAFTLTSGLMMAILSLSLMTTSSTSTSTSTIFLQTGMELVSFFSACVAFNVLLIYTLELFPTCVRNSAMSMVRQAIVFGGVFCPAIVAAGRKKDGLFLTYAVFGMVIGCCGLVVACLPETRGGTLCDTLDEEELKVEKSEQLAIGVGTDSGNVLINNSV